jgi:predicted nucleotidyltransferase
MKSETVLLESITPSLIAEIRDEIIENIAPDQIILFGSAARSDVKAPHDIDIYVIKEGIQNGREVERRIEELFAGRLFALDVIVRTPEQVEASLKGGNSFLSQQILAKGRILYDKRKFKSRLS